MEIEPGAKNNIDNGDHTTRIWSIYYIFILQYSITIVHFTNELKC